MSLSCSNDAPKTYTTRDKKTSEVSCEKHSRRTALCRELRGWLAHMNKVAHNVTNKSEEEELMTEWAQEGTELVQPIWYSNAYQNQSDLFDKFLTNEEWILFNKRRPTATAPGARCKFQPSDEGISELSPLISFS